MEKELNLLYNTNNIETGIFCVDPLSVSLQKDVKYEVANESSELQKYGHYLAYGVNIHPHFSLCSKENLKINTK